MDIKHQAVVFDAADLGAESAFWAGVLDGVVDVDDDWHMVIVDGQFRVGVQLAPDHVPPDWPDGIPKQQIHLDLWVDDFEVAHEHVMSLGAHVLQPPSSTDEAIMSRAMGKEPTKLDITGETKWADGFQVYADPAGHPFCLCWGPPDEDAIRRHVAEPRAAAIDDPPRV